MGVRELRKLFCNLPDRIQTESALCGLRLTLTDYLHTTNVQKKENASKHFRLEAPFFLGVFFTAPMLTEESWWTCILRFIPEPHENL